MSFARLLAMAGLLALAAGPFSLHAAGRPGLVVDPPRAVQPHRLINQNAQAVQFPPQEGTWQLVVFGYTHCPDVCPMTLHKTAQLLKALGPDSTRLQVVFISIDGTRDDARTMKDFVGNFDSQIIGLTGDVETLQAVANEFDVMTRRFQGKTALAYSMVHSSLLYLLDPAGRIRIVYPGGTGIEAMAADLHRLWQPSGSSTSGVQATALR